MACLQGTVCSSIQAVCGLRRCTPTVPAAILEKTRCRLSEGLIGCTRKNTVAVNAGRGGGTAKRVLLRLLARTRTPKPREWHSVCSLKLPHTSLTAHPARGVGRGGDLVCLDRETGSVNSKPVWNTSSPSCLTRPTTRGGSRNGMSRILSSRSMAGRYRSSGARRHLITFFGQWATASQPATKPNTPRPRCHPRISNALAPQEPWERCPSWSW